MNLTRLREMSNSETNGIQLIMLICETLLILLVFNAGSYFSTTTYSKSIDSVGIILTIFLLLWIWVNIKIYGYRELIWDYALDPFQRNSGKLSLSFASLSIR